MTLLRQDVRHMSYAGTQLFFDFTDVLLWLKSQGKGYQTRMNAILREAMIRSQQQKA